MTEPEIDALPPARELADALPLGVALVSSRGELLFVNAELARMTGHEVGALIGKPVETFLPERAREAHVRERQQFMKEPAERSMGVGRHLLARRADGSEFPVEVGLRPVAGERVLATVVDISMRRNLEAGLRSALEAAPFGMLLVDGEGQIALANASLCRTFGYTPAELVGEPLEVLLPQRAQAEHVAMRDRYLREPRPRTMGSGRDLTGRRKDGVEVPVEIGLSHVHTAAGKMALAAVVDISQRKRAELMLREANAQLEEFTYVSSHDLRSPVRGILSLIDFIQEDFGETAPPAVVSNLVRMRERAKRMERLIEDLLSYARAGKRSARVSCIEPMLLFEEITKLQPPSPGMQLELDVRAEAFDGSATPLTTVLRNLYSNALKHHDRSEGTICLRALDAGDYVCFDVTDDGPGIPESVQARMFRLFQTLTASERQGSGLGLAVSKRLVEVHGGRIQLLSKDGQRGTTFRVHWPRYMRSDLDE